MAELASAIIAGASLGATSITQLSSAMNTNRNATIDITNHLDTHLHNPATYCYSGYVYAPPQCIVRPTTEEALCFSKVSDTACGAVFVFSYQVGENGERFAIMGSVPYDYNWYSNLFAVTTIPADKNVDYDLYYSMYYDDKYSASRLYASDGRAVTVKGSGFKVIVTMSEGGHAIMKVDVLPN